MKLGFISSIIITCVVYFSGAGILWVYGTSAEYKTINGEILSVEPLPIKDRFMVRFSDDNALVVDNYALSSFDGYEGRMQVEFYRNIYHDTDYWKVDGLIKLDSWVKQ